MATETYLSITDLPSASEIDDNSLFAIAKDGASYKMAGSVLRGYTEGVATDVVEEALDGKQDTLTFDSAPTANSDNPVKSKGIKAALDAKQNTLTFDEAPTSNSANPVRSSGIKAAIDALGETMAQGDQQLNQKIDSEIGRVDANVGALNDRVSNIEEDLEDYAKTDGSYDAMTVGAAEQLLSNSYIEDSTPYIFRKTANGASVGNRAYIDELVGGTIVWNQLIPPGTSPTTVDGVTFTPNPSNGSWTITGTGNAKLAIVPNFFQNLVVGHTYFVLFDTPTPYVYLTDGDWDAGLYWFEPVIFHHVGPATTYPLCLEARGSNLNVTVTPMWFDLTLMFGSKIADYISSISTTVGVHWFRKLFPNNYYAYDAGSLKSYNPTNRDLAYKTTGLNQWDEQWELGTINTTTGQNATTSNTIIRAKNVSPCIGGESYYLGENISAVFWYGYSGDYLGFDYNNASGNVRLAPVDSYWYRFITKSSYGTTYKNDICINLSSDRNGEYEPYQEFSYNFPAATMRLRGIPKLDANNRLYYDGDTYAQSGTITRRFEQANLSAQNWTMVSAGIFLAPISGRAFAAGKFNLRSDKYATQEALNSTSSNIQSLFNTYGNGLYVNGGSDTIYVCDASCSTLSEFQSEITGSVFIYEKATATTTSAAAFPSTIVVDRYGTERFVDSRAVPVPVGHVTRYTQDLAGKLEAQPDVAADDGDYIIRQTSGKMSLSPLYGAFSSPIMHRILYRGKNLGSEFTSAQKTAIAAGTFDDIWLGDYWTIDGVTYVVADFDYWYNVGTPIFNQHHIVVIPAKNLYNAQMKNTATTVGGYVNSTMRGVTINGTFTPYGEGCGLYKAMTAFRNAFGDALLTHPEYLCNTVTDGVETTSEWYDSIVDLPSEIMFYGSTIKAPMPRLAGTSSKTQLALMVASPAAINTRQLQWLRDVVSEKRYAVCAGNGVASNTAATDNIGVRPVAAIG